MTHSAAGLVFGIYPFGITGMASGVATGAPDDYERLPRIIEDLCGARAFLLRAYVPYSGADSTPGVFAQMEMYAASGVPWDIVLCFRYAGTELDGWLQLIREIIGRYGTAINTLQITGEPNLKNMPDAGDGSQPLVLQALARGVIAAREAVHASRATVKIGFNAVPSLHGDDGFWPAVKEFGSAFAEAVDYVGLDFYPDVFGPPIAIEQLPAAVERILGVFRTENLAAGGIPAAVPLRITENGWPTGPNRSYERQAQALESIIRTVHRVRQHLNITHYELFGLRDANSANDNIFYQFGIMRDDYTPKPAFAVYKNLIRELGR